MKQLVVQELSRVLRRYSCDRTDAALVVAVHNKQRLCKLFVVHHCGLTMLTGLYPEYQLRIRRASLAVEKGRISRY